MNYSEGGSSHHYSLSCSSKCGALNILFFLSRMTDRWGHCLSDRWLIVPANAQALLDFSLSTLAICWPKIFWPGRKRSVGRGSHCTKTGFLATALYSWSQQYVLLHGIAEDSDSEEVFAPVPFTKSHGEVSIHWINRSTNPVCHREGEGMSVS